jgi:hypothetical protein
MNHHTYVAVLAKFDVAKLWRQVVWPPLGDITFVCVCVMQLVTREKRHTTLAILIVEFNAISLIEGRNFAVWDVCHTAVFVRTSYSVTYMLIRREVNWATLDYLP